MNKSNQKSRVAKMTINIVLVLVACALAIPLFAYAQGSAIDLTEDGKVPGKPFEALQQQVDDLKNQISSQDGSDTSGTIKTGYLVVPGPIINQWGKDEMHRKLLPKQGLVLPHGSTVVGFSLQVRDNDTMDATVTLGYVNDPESLVYLDDNVSVSVPDVVMASITTSGESELWQTLADDTIDGPIIDNKNNLYNIWVKWPGNGTWEAPPRDIKGAKMVIEYTLP